MTGVEGKHVVFLSWRDTSNPEGGGAELYLEKIAHGLAGLGARVTIFAAHVEGRSADEVVDGVRYVRAGSKLTVYLRGLQYLLMRRFGRVDVVVDVQNGMPFLSRLVTRKPVIVLVHHVHREQWPVVYPGLSGRIGWWIESRLAPRLYRNSQYVAVSRATRAELTTLGVDEDRIAVIHNGSDPVLSVPERRSDSPTICTVGRLVPHKQVEHAIDAALTLRGDLPDLKLHVVGDGWWHNDLVAYAQSRRAGETVVFHGHVEEDRKQAIYEHCWVMALPSLKEGWGLVIGEAGQHGTPTVAYRSAGGTAESIVDDESGLLVDTQAEFTDALRRVLTDDDLRARLADGARSMTERFTWGASVAAFGDVVTAADEGHLVSSPDTLEVRAAGGATQISGDDETPE